VLLTSLMATAFFVTFYKIWSPNEVVFDEVHFGKFASFYIKGVFFFDVHPPLAKMMLAGWAYLVGYDGHYDFDQIGESYVNNRVPYTLIRAFPAFLNVISSGLIYGTMKHSGYSWLACSISTILYIFDNAMVGQSRLILLDSTLIVFMLASVFSYVRFRKLRRSSFTRQWWLWLTLTGVFLACTISVKMVGTFVIVTIGMAVAIDLWELLDYNYGLPMVRTLFFFFLSLKPWQIQVVVHLLARIMTLIVLPSIIYLSFFALHFRLLPASGPGDPYMSLAFQETLRDNPLLKESKAIDYFDVIAFSHKESNYYFHGSDERYPLHYEDARISSNGRIVSAAKEMDENCMWRVLPTGEKTEGRVMNGDVIQLQHVNTKRVLRTHDVASPLLATNMEMTLVSKNKVKKYEDTLFKVQLHETEELPWSSKIQTFKLISVAHSVGVSTSQKFLPDWAEGRHDVNGNKALKSNSNTWIVQHVDNKECKQKLFYNMSQQQAKVPKKLSFWRKYRELQDAMFLHNSKLKTEHPYMSRPSSWVLMVKGILYWHKHDTKSQIYLAGNVFGWWLVAFSFGVFAILSFALAMTKKRKLSIMKPSGERRFLRSTIFFAALWVMHYIPFFAMERTLFLHHYLPAVACGYMLVGSLYQQIFTDGFDSARHGTSTRLSMCSYVVAAIIVTLHVGMFIFLSPFTYGTGMTTEKIIERKLFPGWDLQYTK
ncbi:glycosyltransferase family 39 protein, partial [Hesseltinella vesiculosa]